MKKTERFEAAGQGLGLLGLARLIGMVTGLLVLCPLGGLRTPVLWVGVFLGAVMELYGLYVARVSHRGFRRALWTELIGGVAAIVVMLALSKWYRIIRVPLMDLLTLCVVCPLAAATKDLLTLKGDTAWAKGADWLCWGYGLFLAVDVGLIGLSLVSASWRVTPPVTAIGLARSLLSVVLTLYFMLFCLHASRSLRR